MAQELFWDVYEASYLEENIEVTFDLITQEVEEQHVDEYTTKSFQFCMYLKVKGSFEKFSRLVDLLMEKQPQIFSEYRSMLIQDVVTMSCFLENNEKATQYFIDELETDQPDIELVSALLKTLHYFGIINAREKRVNRGLVRIAESNIDHTQVNTSQISFYMQGVILQDIIENCNNPQERAIRYQLMDQLQMNPSGVFGQVVEEGYYCNNFSPVELEQQLVAGERSSFLIFAGLLYKYLHSYGFNMMMCQDINIVMTAYWTYTQAESTNSSGSFFQFNYDTFVEMIQTMLSPPNNDYDATSLLWSSVYISDFLLKNQFINLEQHAQSLDVISKVKAFFILSQGNNLWQYDFVHHWDKPESISPEIFKYEKDIFKRSAIKNYEDHQEFYTEIKEITKKMDAYGDQIIESIDEIDNIKFLTDELIDIDEILQMIDEDKW